VTKRASVLLIALGGTISMTRDASGAITPALGASDLVRAVPGIDAIADVEPVSPMTKPGASLSIDDVLGVARLADQRLRAGVDGVVVVQGTDTIEETAFLLDMTVRSDKPVVVTGAMRGAEASGADGPANILAATRVAASPEASELGTLVVLNDEIHAARFVQKSHTALPSAFTSPLAGPLGHVIEQRARIRMRPASHVRPTLAALRGDAAVALVATSLGDDGRMLRELPRLGFGGAVLQGMGAGHVPADVAPIVGDLVATMPVVLATRVHTGPTFTRTYGFAGSESDLLARGVIGAGTLTGLKARLLLMLLLGSGADRKTIGEAFAAYA
jgi:L-asparaginase